MISPFSHLTYQLRNAQIKPYPYSHFYLEEAFPPSFYSELLAALPENDSYSENGTNYFGRRFADPSSISILSFMHSQEFLHHVANTFLPQISAKFKDRQARISYDLRLVRDKLDYQIGPHTDTPYKLVSLLFYLPLDNSLESLGTSIFAPKDSTFKCQTGKHHSFADFDQIYTAPFRPNSCFGFFRTDKSFHGVSPITIPCERNVLLYNLYDAALRN